MPLADRTTEQLGAELIRMVKVMVSVRECAPAPEPGVDHTHYPVLFALARDPGRVSDLAGCVHADVSTVSRQVSHLVEHGLVAKTPDPQDGRVHRLSLTDRGRAVIDQIVTTRGQWLRRVMHDWTDAEAASFLGHLARFSDDLERAKGALRARS